MFVGNESIDWNVQLLPMANMPYSTSSSTYTMENVPTRASTKCYIDFLNSSKWCNVFLLYDIME